MRAVQPSFHLTVAWKLLDDELRVSLKPQVTFFGSLGSKWPAWVMNPSTGLPVSSSTTLPKIATDGGTAAGGSSFEAPGGSARARLAQRQVTMNAAGAARRSFQTTLARQGSNMFLSPVNWKHSDRTGPQSPPSPSKGAAEPGRSADW